MIQAGLIYNDKVYFENANGLQAESGGSYGV